MDEFDFENHRQLNRQIFASNYLVQKIKTKATLALVRVAMLYLFYFLDNYHMTVFVKSLIGFLLIHEALVFTNYLLVISYELFSRIFSRNELLIPSFCSYFDLFNNL